jgi:uridine kinase
MNYADIVVPSSKPNQVAIRFIAQNLKNMMKEFTNIKNYLNEKLLINFYDLYCFF